MNYWKRYISFTIGDKVYTDPFTLEFTSSFDLSGTGTTAKIFNPSEETIELVRPKGKGIKINQIIMIDAGYEDDHGICVIGEIHNSKVETSGTDKILVMEIQEISEIFKYLHTNRTWPNYISAYAVILELALMLGLGIGKIEPHINKIYPRGLSSNRLLKEELKQIARETESDFFIRNQKIYFLSKYSPGIKTGISLSPSTGLIGSPEADNDKLKIKSLFNYKIGSAEYIHVESAKYNSNYKVISGTHSYTDAQAYTEMTVEEVI